MNHKRSFLAALVAVSMAFFGVGCGGDPTPTASSSDSAAVSAPTTREKIALMRQTDPGRINSSLRAETPFRAQLGPMEHLPGRYNRRDRVHAASNGTLWVGICVDNDDSGYAWPSANGVAHVRVDGVDYFVDQPDVWGSCAYTEIPLAPGSHTAVLVEDFYETHELLFSNVGDFTISSGQTISQGADFTDNYCHPSCP